MSRLIDVKLDDSTVMPKIFFSIFIILFIFPRYVVLPLLLFNMTVLLTVRESKNVMRQIAHAKIGVEKSQQLL